MRRRTVDWLRRAVETVAQVGATVLGGPFNAPVGYLPGRRRVDEWRYAVDGLRRVGEFRVVESFAKTIPGVARAAAIWGDLYPSSDRFAIDSTAFLRRLRDSPAAD